MHYTPSKFAQLKKTLGYHTHTHTKLKHSTLSSRPPIQSQYCVHAHQLKGNREQQFHFWFDPIKAFHTYSIVWNTQRIM